MAGYSFSRLPLAGYDRKPLANTYLRQNEPPLQPERNILGVMYPGRNYSNQMPLLYYTSTVLLSLGADVLQVDPDYSSPEFENAPQEVQAAWLAGDARSAMDTAIQHGRYNRLVLAGKSLGTIAISHLLATGLPDDMPSDPILIWLTPLLHLPPVVQAAKSYHGPAIFISGTGDPAYNPQALQEIQRETGAEAYLVENADHSLRVPGDPVASIYRMAETMEALQKFLTKVL